MRIAQRFNVVSTLGKTFGVPSPEGTAEWVRYRPSLRDLSPRAYTPSVETTLKRWAILGGPSRTPTGIGLKS